jgi:NAD+ kinase
LIGLVYNASVPDAGKFIGTLVESLKLQNRSWICSAIEVEKFRDELEQTSVIIVGGGDGTILRTVRVVAPYGVPIVGINMGRVGFMTELRVDEALEMLPMYLYNAEDLRVEERMMLKASVDSGTDNEPRLTVHALNDIVVSRGSVAKLLDIDTVIDGVPFTSYRADALIASTATGSTGYALSAGGPIIYPETRVILIHPVAAHTGLRTGLVLPAESVLEINASDEHNPVLSVDGFPDMQLHAKDTVTVKCSQYVARFLRAHPPNTFYTAVTNRMGLTRRM